MKLFLVLLAISVLVFVETIRVKEQPNDLNNIWPDNNTQYSGYITVNGEFDNGTHLFYWMFESRSNPSTDPVIMWLTGGPGCSSELALFYENGPYKFASDGKTLEVNPYSWNSFANLIYVDQPVGTGFSYADYDDDYVTNEDQIAQDMYNFLIQFFQKFPQYADSDFFIMGESYGGHYVPAISAKILRENAKNGNAKINLQGSAIGNGWVDPIVQYGQYANFAYDNKLIGTATWDILRADYLGCKALIDSGLYTAALVECSTIPDAILSEAGNINVYDIRKQCTYPPLCYDFTPLDNFLARADVIKALGVSPKAQWSECNMGVHSELMGDWIYNLEVDVPLLLAQENYSVLVYSGTDDFICNYYGGREWVKEMQWPGQAQYLQAPYKSWTVNGQQAGHSQSYAGLTWLEVDNAGHMVPLDQPQNALNMVKHFVTKTPF